MFRRRDSKARPRASGATCASSPNQQPGPLPECSAARAVLDRYCVTCHNARLKTAGLLLDQMDVEHVGGNRDVWEKVARKLRTREMPPPAAPRPDEATYRSVASLLETSLDAAAVAAPHPGRVPVHRLNRTEYANAIRDLLALEVDGRSLLPNDEPDPYGFDNVASVLSVSPALLESYMAAASTVSRLAVGDPAINPVVDTFKVPTALVQDDRTGERQPFGSRGGTSIRYQFPLDGEYTIKVVLKRQLYLYLIGMGEPHQIDVRLDGVLLKRFTVGGEGKGMTAPESFAGNTQGDPEWEVYMHTADAGLEVRVPVKAGTREVERLVRPEVLGARRRAAAAAAWLCPNHQRAVLRRSGRGLGPDRRSVPGRAVVNDTPSRRKIFICRPTASADRGGLREDRFCRRWRAAPTAGRSPSGRSRRCSASTRPAGPRAASTRAFSAVSDASWPRRAFCSASNASRRSVAPGTPYRLDGIDLASRLSFFLWSSIPDDELLDAAVRGTLDNPAVLEQQVRRMLRDPRSQALVDNFAGQWLKLGKLAGVVPDVDEFPDFDENLREAMQQETRLFIDSQLRDDRSVMDLLTAELHVRERAAGAALRIPDVYGSHFRRVRLRRRDARRPARSGQHPDGHVVSEPDLAGPARQVAAREHARRAAAAAAARCAGAQGERRGRRAPFGARAARSAPEEPDLRGVPRADGSAGVLAREFRRARQVANRERWRADRCVGVACPTAAGFRASAGLRQLLLSHREEFVRTFTEKLLAYALGRGVEYRRPAGRSQDRAGGGRRRPSLVVPHHGHRQERAVQHEHAARRSRLARPRAPRLDDEARQSGGHANDHHQESDTPPHGAARHRRDAGAAAARRHGAGADGAGADGRQADQPVRRDVRRQRHDHGEVDAGRRGRGVRAHADARRAGAVPRSAARAERAGAASRRRAVPAAPTPKPARGS